MDQPPPIPNREPEALPPPRMSLPARLLNIFAIPGAVLDDVNASRPSVGSWIVPILLASIVSAILFSLTIAQPAALERLREERKQKVAEMVTSGKSSQAEADQTIKVLEWLTRPDVMKALSGVVATVISCLRVFWWAFALWLLGRLVLKREFSYLKAAEVAGLASMIVVLGTIATMLLTSGGGDNGGVATASNEGRLATRRSATFVLILANLFSVWFVTLLAAGLARLAGVRLSQTLLPVMGIWIAVQLALAVLGITIAGVAG
jgi:hypothetical protein